MKRNKTKRGYGKKNERKNMEKLINFSLIGTNAAGLTSKKESFFSILNQFKPSVFTVQETKHTKAGCIKIPGYQTFEKVRTNKGGGGLITTVDEDLNPVLITNSKDDIEIITVQAEIGKKKIRIINGYGPQEDDDIEKVINFWQEFEVEVIKAKDENCFVIIQMDANAKVGNSIIKDDPHTRSSNGKIMMDVVERQHLVIANSLDICKTKNI